MVIRLNRNRCQYCRFKKCLVVGMSRDCEFSKTFDNLNPQLDSALMCVHKFRALVKDH